MKIGWFLSMILLAGCVTNEPPELPQETKTYTGYLGVYEYTPEWYGDVVLWTREDPFKRHEKNPDAWKRRIVAENEDSRPVYRVMSRINPEQALNPKVLRTEQEMWDQIRYTWEWCARHMKQDLPSMKKLHAENPSGPSLHDHAKMWLELEYMPVGSGGSVSHLFVQMLLQGGVPADRVALAQALYPKRGAKGGVAAHAYVILYFNDTWRYLDLNVREKHPGLPKWVGDFTSLGVKSTKRIEYTWPVDTAFYQPHPFEGRLPLVED